MNYEEFRKQWNAADDLNAWYHVMFLVAAFLIVMAVPLFVAREFVFIGLVVIPVFAGVLFVFVYINRRLFEFGKNMGEYVRDETDCVKCMNRPDLFRFTGLCRYCIFNPRFDDYALEGTEAIEQ